MSRLICLLGILCCLLPSLSAQVKRALVLAWGSKSDLPASLDQQADELKKSLIAAGWQVDSLRDPEPELALKAMVALCGKSQSKDLVLVYLLGASVHDVENTCLPKGLLARDLLWSGSQGEAVAWKTPRYVVFDAQRPWGKLTEYRLPGAGQMMDLPPGCTVLMPYQAGIMSTDKDTDSFLVSRAVAVAAKQSGQNGLSLLQTCAAGIRKASQDNLKPAIMGWPDLGPAGATPGLWQYHVGDPMPNELDNALPLGKDTDFGLGYRAGEDGKGPQIAFTVVPDKQKKIAMLNYTITMNRTSTPFHQYDGRVFKNIVDWLQSLGAKSPIESIPFAGSEYGVGAEVSDGNSIGNFTRRGRGFQSWQFGSTVVEVELRNLNIISFNEKNEWINGRSEYRLSIRDKSYIPTRTSLDMVTVPGGSFLMGSPESEPNREPSDKGSERQHTVNLADFAVSRTEVTVGQFREFVQATGYKTSAEQAGGGWALPDSGKYVFTAGICWNQPGFAQTDEHPVVCVSWYDTIAYANWLSKRDNRQPAYTFQGKTDPMAWPTGWNTTGGNEIVCDWAANGYRLPTEAEWELAARGGANPGEVPEFLAKASMNSFAWFGRIGWDGTRPVAMLVPNTLGLFDTLGNVYEWCWDWYQSDIGNLRDNPRGPATGSTRALRGGGWPTIDSYVRIANRLSGGAAGYVNTTNGFRLVSSQPDAP